MCYYTRFYKMKFLKFFLRSIDKDSYWHLRRLERFAIFMKLLKKEIAQPLRIIDIGGTPRFWDNMGIANDNRFIIHCFNIKRPAINYKNILCFLGDATDLKDIRDKEYDVAFSNSVIEHVYTFENQKKMANEIKRVAKRYFLQTPNFWFPVEPHFRLPLVHYFPPNIRTLLVLLSKGRRITDFKRIKMCSGWHKATH
ncbi:MAG: hypothetical protein A2W05_06570 [Candidatus Schekmanbacteria bacterium RBG_16_38_10]|uniref:Methyltransferase type 11 domain-containing protein n=1 Tax=Candidatus Schekmanbacteria bacterium RBG_16_38_10 TaxID=1817879 RepID=A0A1F7RV10_9BACT|nr:MAG: hypothetical protein A2W05_06570 [Candidatus Schekmanbacteria bacterium RBG_16_38_10]